MEKLETLPISKIRPSPFQPRETFEKDELKTLADSMKSLNLLQPIIVRPHRGGYQIACGERRWRAAQMAGWDSIPAVVKDMDERALQLYSLVENMHRLDLKSHEKENAVHSLWKDHYEKEEKSRAELARDLGVSDNWVSNLIISYDDRDKIRLPSGIKEKVSTSDLSLTRGIGAKARKSLLSKKAKQEISRKELEDLVPIVKGAPPKKQNTIVREVTSEIDEARKIVTEEAKAYAKGEMEARDIKVQLDADQKRLNRFLDTRNQIRYWTVAGIEMIKSEKMRHKAVEYLEEVRDYLDDLLESLRERDWYGG